MIKAPLQPGARAVYIDLGKFYEGTIISIGHPEADLLGQRTSVTLEFADGTEETFPLDRHLVPANACRARFWDGRAVLPYEWTR